MDFEWWTSALGLLTGFVGLLKSLKWILDGLEGRVKKLIEFEVSGLAQRVTNLQGIVIDLRKKTEEIMKEQGEIRTQLVGQRILIGEIAADVKAGQKEQAAAMVRLEKSSVEWITDELAKIKGSRK